MSIDGLKKLTGINAGEAVYKGLKGDDNRDTWLKGNTDTVGDALFIAPKQQEDAAKKAANDAVLAAKKLADEQDQAFNKANMKKPNYLGIKSNNSSFDTTLLGGGGSSALLGKSTLLGR